MFKFNKKLGKRIVSAVIAYSVVFGTLVWDPAARKQVVNADATMFDSASAINYATILGGAVDYGIVAETIEQTSHTETTFATNHFIHTSSNIDVDYVTSTALFLIGRTYTPGSGDIERYIRFGRTTASAIYFEAPTAVFGNYNPAIQAGKNITNGNFRFEGEYTNTPFIAAENANAYKNVDRLIDRICSQKPAEDVEKGWSYFLNDRAKSPEYVLNANDNPSKYITYDGDAHVYFDLTDPQFNEKVVYINISKDSRLRQYLGKSSGFQIKKNESSVVVINIEDDGQDGALNLNKPIVTVDGVSYSGVTATNGGDPVGAAAVQKNFNESIIWNVMEKSPVLLTDMGGAVLAPLAESVSLQGGNSSGWVVTPGKFNMNTEFHFLYSGSSRDSYGQMHFALTKAFTKKYAKHGEVKQDTSVSIPDDSTYKFYFQEYKAPSQLHGDLVTPIGQKQSVYAQTNAAVTFPVLSFYCDNYDRLTEQQRHFYIEKPSSGTASKTYYFKVTEDPSSPVGITNSNGYIDIRLKVQVDSAGKFTYFVDYKSVTGDGIVFRDYEEDYTDFITMSGVQFDLGSFYNKVNDGITICKTDVAGGSEISGAVLTITRTEGPGQFDVNGITAERTDSNGNITTFTKNTTGTTPADNELLISGSSISYKTNENGNVTIKNLPNGKYTLTETTTPDGYETAEQITFEIAGGNIKNCKDANGNTITMIDRKNVSFKIAKQAAGDATANLAGAKLTLSSVEGYDLTGAMVTGCNGEPVKNGSKISVVTTNEALTFSNLPSGRYVLTEDAAPEGFSTQSSIRFKVDSKGVITAIGDLENDQGAITEQGGTYTLAMFDAVLVNIRKQNTQGAELNGAVFQIYKADGQTKVGSTLSVGNYSTALGAGDYILREETAPEGYATAKDIAFSVEVENGVGTVKVGGTALTNNTIVVIDEQGFRIKILKQYWDKGFLPLEGARMTITASDGSNGNPSWYWTSGTETHVITGLLPGVTYTLTETSAPRGYVKVDPITFTITPKNANEGTCEIVLSQGDSGRLLKSEPYNYASAYNPATDGDLYYTNFYDGELTLYDDTNPDEVGKIVLTKTIKGPVTDEDIKGLTFKVKDENGNAIWTHKLSDSVFTVSTDSNGNKVYTATIDHLNVNKEYTVEETLHTIEGFNVNVTYKVDGASGTGATTGKIKPVEVGTNVDYEDTYTYRGELKVAKALNGIPGHENDDKIFTFKVKVGDTDGYLQADGTIGSAGYEFTVTPAEVCKVPVDSSAFGKKLTVIESDTDREISGFELTNVGYSENNGTVTIDSNTDDKTVTITNSYKKDTKNGSIVLTKTIKGPVTEEDLSTGVKGIVFEIWEEGNTTTPYATLKLGTDFAPSTDGSGNLVYTKTLTGLDTDKMYTVKETKYVVEGYSVTQTYKIGAQSGSGPETEGFKPTINGTAVDFENDYQRIKGELKVTKTLSGYTGTGSSRTFTFYVKAGDQYIQANGTLGTTRYPFTLTTGETCKVPVDYAAFGKALTVEEDTDESNVAITGYDFSGVSYSNNNGTVTVDSATDDETVSITNTYKEQPSKGYITLTKTISGDVTDEDLKGLTFTVKDADGNVIATRKLGDDFEKVTSEAGTKGTYQLKTDRLIEVADASKTYTVEETLHTLAGFDVTVTNKIGGGSETTGTTASVTGGVSTDSTKPTEVAYENDYSKKVSKGYITLTKTISGDVTDEDLKGLTFTVKDVDGNVIATRKLGDDFEKVTSEAGTKGTYQLKADRLIEVADASKTYTVEETLHTLAGFDVTVTNKIGGGSETTGTTASVTGGVSTDSTKPTEVAYENDYSKKVAKGYITLTKTISGDVTDEDLKGLTFTIKDADGNVIATRKLGDDFEKVTSEAGTKGTYQLKADRLIEVADASKTYTVEETLHTLAGFDITVTNKIGGGSETTGTTASVTGGVSTDSTKPTEVAYENDYSKKVSKGYITLTKTISGDVTDEDLKGLTFTVKDADGNIIATRKLGDDFEKVTSEAGTKGTYQLKAPIEVADASKTYTVEETLHTLAGFDVKVTNTIGGTDTAGTTATITGGVSTDSTKPTEVAYENDYSKKVSKGYITLTKTISGDVTDEDLKGLTFTVKDADGNVIATRKLGDDFEKVTSEAGTKGTYQLKAPIEVADASKTYTVEETLHTLAGFDVKVSNTIGSTSTTGATATITGGVSTDSTKPTEVAYKNDYVLETGSLTLKKTVKGTDGSTKTSNFTFYVKGEDGKWYDKDGKASGTQVGITVKANDTTGVKISGIPVQKYDITEADGNAAAADGYELDGSNSDVSKLNVSVDKNQNTTVTLINAYKTKEVDKGSLTLKKTVTGPDGSTKTTNFTFYVKGEDGKWYDKDGKASGTQVGITVKANDTTGVKISGLPVQKYDITEADGNDAAADGYELDGAGSVISKTDVEVIKNQNTDVTLTNAYKTKDVDSGSLTLKKTVKGPDGSTKTTKFTFYVKGANGKYYDKDGKASTDKVGITVDSSDSNGVKISGLPVQKYDITEADGNAAASDGYELDGANSDISKDDVEVIKDQNTDVTLTNAYKKTEVDSGSLTLKKTVKGPDGSTKTTKFTFYVKGANGKYYDKDGKASTDKVGITVDSSDSNGVKITGLPVQKYDITEADGNAAASDGYELDGANSDISKDDVDVLKDQNTDVTLTNTYKKTEVGTGKLTLSKKLNNAEGCKTTTFTFYVKGADGKWYGADGKPSADKVDIPVTVGTPVTISGLPVQNYTVTEADANKQAKDTYVLDGENSVTTRNNISVEKDQTAAAELINTYKKSTVPETGSIKVSKTEAGTVPTSGIPTSYSFYVKCGTEYLKADGTFGDKSDAKAFTVKPGNETEVTGLELGKTYTIEEASYNVPDGYTVSVTYSSSKSVTLDSTNKSDSVKITNTYITKGAPLAGSLVVTKRIAGSVPSSGMPDSYKFYVKCGDLFVQSDGTLGENKYLFTITPNKSLTIIGLDTDNKTYQVVEEPVSNSDLPDGYKWSVVYSSESVTFKDPSDSGDIEITNNYTRKAPSPTEDKGSLALKKTVSGPSGCTNTSSFTFYVKGADKKWYDKNGTAHADKVEITVKAGETVTISGLPVQTYTVTEKNPADTAADGYEIDGNKSVPTRVNVEVVKAGTAEAELINAYKKSVVDTGSLTLKKTVKGPDGSTKTTNFTFYVKGADGKYYDKDGKASSTKTGVTVSSTDTDGVKITGIPVQTYDITEADGNDAAADGYELDGANSDVFKNDVDVTKDNNTTVTLINAYKKSVVDTGSLTLKKTVKGPDGSTKTTEFTFYVKGADGNWYDKDGKASSTKVGVTVKSTDTDGVKITGIPVQKYDVTEADGNDAAADGYELDGANSDVFKNDVEVNKDTNTTVTLINAYKTKTVQETGSIILKKTVSGDTGCTKTTDFTFYVKGADGKWYDKDGKASTTKVGVIVSSTDTDGVKITGIPAQKYDITEDTDNTAADNYDFDGANSEISKTDVEVTKDVTPTVTLVNAYKKASAPEKGDLVLKKTVKGPTGYTTSKTFKFYVKGEDGKWYDKDGKASSTQVAVEVGANKEVTIKDIPVQKYDITEDTNNTAEDGYELDTANSTTSRTGVSVTSTKPGEAELINAYKTKTVVPEFGNLSFTKTFSGDVLENEVLTSDMYFVIERTDITAAAKYLKKDGTFTSDATAARIKLTELAHNSGSLVWSLDIANVPVGTYKITEYNTTIKVDGSNVTFILDKGSVTSGTANVAKSTTGKTALVNKYNLPGYDVKISKQDIAKKELPKATLTLTSLDGNDLSGAVVKQGSKTIKITVSADKKSISFVTGTTPSVVSGLKPGTYELKETVTPEAYLTADAIKFTIERNGTIRDDKGTVIVTGSPIVMIDKADPNYKKHSSVPATGVGTSPANVIGSIVLAIGAACCAGIVIYLVRRKKYS